MMRQLHIKKEKIQSVGGIEEKDLWFLPGPPEDEPAYLLPLPRSEPGESAAVAAWAAAQAALSLQLARVAVRFGALDDRLRRGPEGWRHRLALAAAAELGWLVGEPVAVDRLGLWQAMRLSAASEDSGALERSAWAFRRLSGGPGPDADLARFLGRRESDGRLSETIAAWDTVMVAAAALHPIVRACFAFHLWPLAGIGGPGNRIEGAVIAVRLAAAEGQGGALFAPLQVSGAMGIAAGSPAERLGRWLQAIEAGILRAMRHVDGLEQWHDRARKQAAALSGRTPPRLIEALLAWPMVTAPMAETLTGSSRAAVQRNLAWFERKGLVTEVTGQGRFRVWRAAI